MKKCLFASLLALLLGGSFFLLPISAQAVEALPLPIIMYHHISESPEAWSDYTVSPETLAGDLRYLRELGYTSIRLQDLEAYSRGEATLPEKSILITFDDGQESFLKYGLPLFEEYDMCAVLAIIGSCADAYTEIEDHNLRYSYFSWPALAELNASPHVELAIHTYDMHDLNRRPGCRIKAGEDPLVYAERFARDLTLMESRFERYVGQIPATFVYPFGCYCKEGRAILVEHGYRILLTCNPRVNQLHRQEDALLSLGRFNRPNGMDRSQFFRQMGL